MMSLSDSMVLWMMLTIPSKIWEWMEALLGGYVFAMMIWQRLNYWLFQGNDGTAFKRLAQVGAVVKGSAAIFVCADSFTAPVSPKPFVLLLLTGVAIEQTASFFAQRRINRRGARGTVTAH